MSHAKTHTIALLNQKGGTGKTTCAVNIGAGLTKLGKKVLLIDMDPQAALTYSLGVQGHALPRTIYEVLKGETTIQETVIDRDGLLIIPSNLNLSGAELELGGTPGREFLLKEALDNATDIKPDYAILDCPPTLGLLVQMALVATTEIYVPVQTEYLALHGLSRLVKTVDLIKKRLNNKLEITGIIATRFHKGKNLHKEVLAEIRERFGKLVFNTVVRENIALAEAPSFGKTIFEYKPRSRGAEDYTRLCKEILKRGRG